MLAESFVCYSLYDRMDGTRLIVNYNREQFLIFREEKKYIYEDTNQKQTVKFHQKKRFALSLTRCIQFSKKK